MAGQAWKYSGELDERDLTFLQHEFITVSMGVEYYGFSIRPLVSMVKDAGAFYKIGKMVRIAVLPVRVGLCIADMLLKTVMKLESFVIGIAVWFLILCAISAIINGLWRQLGILAILFLCIIAFMFAELLLSSLIEDLCDGLRRI